MSVGVWRGDVERCSEGRKGVWEGGAGERESKGGEAARRTVLGCGDAAAAGLLRQGRGQPQHPPKDAPRTAVGVSRTRAHGEREVAASPRPPFPRMGGGCDGRQSSRSSAIEPGRAGEGGVAPPQGACDSGRGRRRREREAGRHPSCSWGRRKRGARKGRGAQCGRPQGAAGQGRRGCRPHPLEVSSTNDGRVDLGARRVHAVGPTPVE